MQAPGTLDGLLAGQVEGVVEVAVGLLGASAHYRRPLLEVGIELAEIALGRERRPEDYGGLPLELAFSALTPAVLAPGPHVAADAKERWLRQDRLQRDEAAFDALPFDAAQARAYGRVYAAVTSTGRKAAGRERST